MSHTRCMRCGSGDVRMPSLQEGGHPGFGMELNEWTCLRCGWLGAAVVFDDKDEADAFASAQAKAWAADGRPTG